jgi:parallel beta-helix repeat protein
MTQNAGKTGVRISVGHADADIVGTDNVALQAGMDYLAGLGGGLLEIGPGTYEMRDSLHLRDNVIVAGSGEATVLRKCDAAESPMVLDGDYGEEQVTLADPAGFRPGDGISVTDDASGGFHTVVARVLWVDGQVLGVSLPMNADYLVRRNARATTTFPVISGYHISGARVRNLAIDGNKGRNPHLNGCRGAGIFLYRAHGTEISGCIVQDYFGDGISFQQSQGVSVEECTCVGNTHLGLHPGSGSGTPTVRNCTSKKNGQIGLFLCWRVKHGLFEGNVLADNGDTGISIGHKDTDNAFLHNRVTGNGREGVLFRDESEPMAGHRNRFEENEILDNGGDEAGYGIRILGETHDLAFVRNRVGNRDTDRQRVGICIGDAADSITLTDNDLSGNTESDVEDQRST